MSYKALYRAYRPQSFVEVAGQKHVTKTFQNALKNGKITHAYLFSGPRGTGKTSVAKIIANVVNCDNYPISEPCGECDNCLTIQKGMFADILEIDAASNNGVDEIREIRDKVKYTPSQGKYKVYIIDEVHMLSIGAFNALLKTLEEPPSHVIFILATTEPHKIPATILSRCQRFDFKEISLKDIKKKLHEIIEKENIQASLEAVDAIAEAAEGGMRDALSLLDQAISYADASLTDKDVHAVAGTVSYPRIISILNDIADSNVYNALTVVDKLIEDGKEVSRINHQMIIFLKDLLVYKNVSSDTFFKTIYQNEEFMALAQKLTNEIVFYYIECLTNSQREMRFTNNPRTFLELTLIKMTDKVQQGESGIIKRIEALESKIDSTKLETQPVQEVKKQVVETPKVDVVVNESPEEVIDNKEVIEPTKIDQETNLEEPKQEIPVHEESKDEIIEEPVNEEVKPQEAKVDEPKVEQEPEVFETVTKVPVDIFDVKLITENMNRAMSDKVVAKENRELLQQHWNQINIKADPNVFALAKEFSSGKIVLATSDFFIITYDHVIKVNKVMRSDSRQKVEKLLFDVYSKTWSYLALPHDLWLQKRQEYYDQFSVGILEPNLKPIEYPGLEVIEYKREVPEVVEKAINLFGEDKISIK